MDIKSAKEAMRKIEASLSNRSSQAEFERKRDIAKIQDWLDNRPSASMDSCLDAVVEFRNFLADVRCHLTIRKERFPTNMMAAQEGKVAEQNELDLKPLTTNLQPISESFNGKIIC